MKLFDPVNMLLICEPGTCWIYGHSFDWLGLIVESVSGQKLSGFLQENIFAKAGMTSCSFQVEEPSAMENLHDKSGEKLKVFK